VCRLFPTRTAPAIFHASGQAICVVASDLKSQLILDKHITPVTIWTVARRFFFCVETGRAKARVGCQYRGNVMATNASFQNIKSTMKTEHALPLHECRVSEAVERPWGRPYRTVEWALKNDPCRKVSVVPAECTTSEIADVLRAHIPGRRYGPADAD
jgi:hypothetical protein